MARLEAGHVQRQRRARVGAGDGVEQQGGVGHRAGQGAVHVEREPRRGGGPARYAARRRAEPDDVAEAGRVAQRASEVAAVGEGCHARGEGGGGPAAAAAARLRQVPGVAGRAEHLVEGLRAGPQFGRVGLAEGDRAGGPLALDDEGRLVGHVVLEGAAAEGGADAGGDEQVLVNDGQAVQGADREARRQVRVRRVGGGERRVGHAGHDGVDARIEPVDAVEMRLHDLARRHRPPADQLGQPARRQLAQVRG